MEKRDCIFINNKEQDRSDCNMFLLHYTPRHPVKPFAHPQSVCFPLTCLLNNTTQHNTTLLPHMDVSPNWVEETRAYQWFHLAVDPKSSVWSLLGWQRELLAVSTAHRWAPVASPWAAASQAACRACASLTQPGHADCLCVPKHVGPLGAATCTLAHSGPCLSIYFLSVRCIWSCWQEWKLPLAGNTDRCSFLPQASYFPRV